MKNLMITINDKEFEVKEGQTLLEVIKENNITEVPTLCHNKLLEPFNSCFLCVTEIAGMRSLKPSCSTTVTDGMVVKTDTSKIHESRKMNLELLLSNHYADCYPPCKLECPANMDIQGYIALAARGLYREAQMLMRETNALPLVCGKVCARPCETACRRNFVDESVDIKNIKRFLSEKDLDSGDIYIPECAPDTGKKVAVIGSGPAGLSAAHYLRIKGHSVTIFEKMPKAGGMMRYGIPEYRMPKADLQKEIDIIVKMGAEIEFNKELGKDITIDGLEKEFDSIFIGIGAQLGSSIGIDGENLDGVKQGVDYLREVGLGTADRLRGNVFIIGGGNTAIDTARTSLRMGADKVTIIYRRTEAEMPADIEEIHDAKDEGIDIRILNNPVEYIGESGKLKSIKLIKMELGEPDASGRRRPNPIEGSEYIEDVDFIFAALGQKIDPAGLDDIELSKWGTINVDRELFLTSRKGIFAGGDALDGGGIIISAVAHGRKAAHVIDRYLNDEELIPENRLGFYIRKDDFKDLTDEDFSEKEKIERKSIEKEAVEKRRTSMMEVELGFTEENLLEEAARCMECGCQDIYECKLKSYSEEYGADKMKFIGGDYRVNKYESEHRYINVNTEKCINCGLCFNVCSTVQKQSVFYFDQRGFDTTIVPYNYKALDDTNCISCGLCVASCPTGAITEKLPLGKPGPFENRTTESHCNLCGDGCEYTIEAYKDQFVKINSKNKNEFFDNLCDHGRFGYEKYLNRTETLLSENEVNKVKEYMNNCDKNNTLVSISPELTIGEIDLVIEFAKKNNFDFYSNELSDSLNKISYLNENNIPPGRGADMDISLYKEIFYFGDFSEEKNSVSFRKLLRNDKNQNIHLMAEIKESYFNHTRYDSPGEMIDILKNSDFSKSLIAFNIQNTDENLIKELTKFITDNKIQNYMILNNFVNASYLLKKIVIETKDKFEKGEYETVIAFNAKDGEFLNKFKNRVIFSDIDMGIDGKFNIPINSIYAKTGSFYDQYDVEKNVVRGVESKFHNLNEFLK